MLTDIPLMALTATAPPHTFAKLNDLLNNPIVSKGSVNKPNISYQVHEISSQGGIDKYTNLASQLIPEIEEAKTLLFVDFIRDVAPLAISLRQQGLQSCGYHGEKMTSNDKAKTLENWRSGEIQVMVCTSAFAMGIDQGDIDKVIRVGCPPSIEQMVQEFGRAGRDGRPCQGKVFYHENDLQHAAFWCKAESDSERKSVILQEYQHCWRFCHAHLAGLCRRSVILQYFEEDTSHSTADTLCCDVCVTQTQTEDAQAQIIPVLQTIADKPGFGEKKIAESVRASKGLPLSTWRDRVRQAWLTGLLSRDMDLGKGHNLVGHMVYNTFTITTSGNQYLLDPTPLHLPIARKKPMITPSQGTSGKLTRQGKGCQALPIVRRLMRSSADWYTISSEADYHYPGVFSSPQPQCMGFCPDIRELPKYDASNEEFLFTDIQFSKGTARNPRKTTFSIDGRDEMLNYRIVPCGAVKLCSKHTEGCNHVVAKRERARCLDHPQEPLIPSANCTVEFVYLWPDDQEDKRRWLTAISRECSTEKANLHTHPIPPASKIPSKLKTDWKSAVVANPTTKTHNLMMGEGMDYMPAASSLAASHRGKLKNLRLAALRESDASTDPRACILKFEKEALSYDDKMKKETKSTHLDDYSKVGHPYVRDYSITTEMSLVLCMSPLQSEILSKADCMEVDVTYKASVEFDYLFNAVVFNYTTLRWHVIARVRMNKLTTEAYRQAFQAILTTAKSDYPGFAVGKTLKAIVVDWSDQQLQGLEEVVGRDTAAAVVKGCQVHYTRSVKRVSERINKGNPLAIRAFNAIAYHIPQASSPEEVAFLFEALAGEADIAKALNICKASSSLLKYADTHVPSSWKSCKHWISWWTKPKHLRMLASCCAEMNAGTFKTTPNDTNAVESHNRCSKGSKPDILKVALMSTYKVDMAAALEHLAGSQGIRTSYDDMTPAARAKRSAAANKARGRKRARDNKESNDGPPDKRRHFVKDLSKGKEDCTTVKSEDCKSRIYIDSDKEEEKEGEQYWVKSLGLWKRDETILCGSSWLNSNHVNAAMALVREHFPEVKGLQDTTRALSVANGLCSQPSGSIQVHHLSDIQHWVTSAFIGGDIVVYDSLFSKKKGFCGDLLQQLVAIYKEAAVEGELRVLVPAVQQQKGGNDCGVFSIAFLFHVALGDKPEELVFTQSTMRKHLSSCFSNKCISAFTQTYKRSRIPSPVVMTVPI